MRERGKNRRQGALPGTTQSPCPARQPPASDGRRLALLLLWALAASNTVQPDWCLATSTPALDLCLRWQPRPLDRGGGPASPWLLLKTSPSSRCGHRASLSEELGAWGMPASSAEGGGRGRESRRRKKRWETVWTGEGSGTHHTLGHTQDPTLLREEPAPSVVGSRQSTGRKSEVASGRHSLAPRDRRHSKARTGPGRRTPRKGPTVGHRSPKGGLMPGWTVRLPQLTASSDSKPAGLHPRWAGGHRPLHRNGAEQTPPPARSRPWRACASGLSSSLVNSKLWSSAFGVQKGKAAAEGQQGPIWPLDVLGCSPVPVSPSAWLVQLPPAWWSDRGLARGVP